MLPDTNPIIEVSAESNGGFTNEYQLVGLGYDSFFNDYKLVRVIFHLRYQVDVYSLKTNSWKVIGSIPLRRFGFSLNDGGVALNGSIYWLVASKRGQFDRWIVGFNLKDEEFIELQLPPNEPNRCYYSVNLRVIEGCLGVYCSRWKVGDIFVVLWMMKEHVKEEWIKLVTISSNVGGRIFWDLTDVESPCFFDNGQVFFYTTQYNSELKCVVLLVYDPKLNMVVKTIPVHGISSRCFFVTYTESLVSPNAWKLEFP
ncbi:hypothetical protein LguiB_014567 [Lonicera macranthoides]